MLDLCNFFATINYRHVQFTFEISVKEHGENKIINAGKSSYSSDIRMILLKILIILNN